MKSTPHFPRLRLELPAILALVITFLGSGTLTPNAYADERVDSSTEITTLFRAARKVISTNQELINEPASGKMLTADYVVAEGKKNFTAATGADLDLANDPSNAKSAMLTAVRDVMNEAQDLINDPEIGFKGFLPAIFARQVATGFGRGTDGQMKIKLTAPKKYLRNRANCPDKWEANIIDTLFSAPRV